MTIIPDHVGKEACRLLNENSVGEPWDWSRASSNPIIITVAKLLMDPPAPMTDPDEEAAKRVILSVLPAMVFTPHELTIATEQMRKEFAARKEEWEAGR